MKGDLASLEKEIDKNMQVFIQSGVYFALEKLRYLTLRNLFKKISTALAKNPELCDDKPHIIPLSIPFQILREWDSELDIDELECMIAHIISTSLIRGYISHNNQVLVLAKDKAFP
jgi:Fe-S cluster assembly ATPase SufC